MSPHSSVYNSVFSLKNLYSITVGISLSLMITNLINLQNTSLPFNLSLIPFFIMFLVTIVPFYHGAIRHLDKTFIEEKTYQVRKGALLVDFFLLFMEACALIAIASLVKNSVYFIYGIITLLSLDVIWGFLAYLAFSTKTKSNAELRWALLNLITSTVILLSIEILPFIMTSTQDLSSRLDLKSKWLDDYAYFIVIFLTLRTIFDYSLNWNFYFPDDKETLSS